VYYQDYDPKTALTTQILTVITPKGLDKIDLPLIHLENFFAKVVSHEMEKSYMRESIIQVTNLREKELESLVSHGVFLKDFFVNFSLDGRAKNEFTDVFFWLSTICCAGLDGDEADAGGNIFFSIRERLDFGLFFDVASELGNQKKASCDTTKGFFLRNK
jgi:hypothetical protein